MPRLTNKTYLKQRAHLRHLWFEKNGGGMSRLTGTEQWDLHGYFALAEDVSEAQVLQHRQEVTREQPSLPQRAGRAYARLQAIEQQPAKLPIRPMPVKRGKRTNRRTKDLNIQVHALVRPEIDYERLARALLEHARNEEEKRRGDAETQR